MKAISVPRETNEQQTLIRWGQYHPICSKYLIAIPNGGSRHLLEGVKLKKEGVKRGVSDLFLAYPSNGFHGLWLEMKRRSTYAISPAQREWLSLMKGVGYAAHIAIGWEEGVRIIKEYLGEELHTIFD